MFVQILLEHDFLLRLGSKVCGTVAFQIVYKKVIRLADDNLLESLNNLT